MMRMCCCSSLYQNKMSEESLSSSETRASNNSLPSYTYESEDSDSDKIFKTSYDGLPITKQLEHGSFNQTEPENDESYIDSDMENCLKDSIYIGETDRLTTVKLLNKFSIGEYIIRRKIGIPRQPYVMSMKMNEENKINHIWIYVDKHEVKKDDAVRKGTRKKYIIDDCGDFDKPEIGYARIVEQAPKTVRSTDWSCGNSDRQKRIFHRSRSDFTEGSFSFSERTSRTLFERPLKRSVSTRESFLTVEQLISKKRALDLQINNYREIRHAYYIDNGRHLFKSVIDLLKYYQNKNLDNVFNDCNVIISSKINLNSFIRMEHLWQMDSHIERCPDLVNEEEHVFEKIERGRYVMKYEDQDDHDAIENNWIKLKFMGEVKYAPKNFVLPKLVSVSKT